LARTMRLLPK